MINSVITFCSVILFAPSKEYPISIIKVEECVKKISNDLEKQNTIRKDFLEDRELKDQIYEFYRKKIQEVCDIDVASYPDVETAGNCKQRADYLIRLERNLFPQNLSAIPEYQRFHSFS